MTAPQKKPIALQLYTLREQAKTDYRAVLKRVADIGYKGVEPAGFYNLTPAQFRKEIEDLGMTICSSHGPWAKPDNLQQVIEVCGSLGLDLAATGYGRNEFATLDAIKRTADMVNGMADTLAKSGLRLFLHNHDHEFAMVEGRLAYDWFSELAPKALFELDIYWAANFGANDPAEQVRKFKGRVPLLHVKDGPLVKGEPMTAVGQGKVNIPAAIAAADQSLLRWLIVELDACKTDMVKAVEDSYNYMTGNGLAAGNR